MTEQEINDLDKFLKNRERNKMTDRELLQQVFDEMIDRAGYVYEFEGEDSGNRYSNICKAIHERLLTQERSDEQPEQEPVAYMLGDDHFADARCFDGGDGIPLFTKPDIVITISKQMPLTDEQIEQAIASASGIGRVSLINEEVDPRRITDVAKCLVRAIEAAHGIK